MDKSKKEEMKKNLFRIFAETEDPDDISTLLDDLCTQKEIGQMAERLRAAELLMEGKTYTQVMEETEISSATLSRVSRCVQYGKGYSKLLSKEDKN